MNTLLSDFKIAWYSLESLQAPFRIGREAEVTCLAGALLNKKIPEPRKKPLFWESLCLLCLKLTLLSDRQVKVERLHAWCAGDITSIHWETRRDRWGRLSASGQREYGEVKVGFTSNSLGVKPEWQAVFHAFLKWLQIIHQLFHSQYY